MKKPFIALGFASGLLLASCGATPELIEPSVPFNAKAASIINKKGSANIEGQAFLKRRDGQVVTCAGEKVYLTPATEYAEERFRGIYGNENGGYRPAIKGGYSNASVPEYYELARETSCDAEGDFTFNSIANGEYYVSTSVLWRISDYYYEGGNLSKKITIKNGRSQKLILTSK